MRYRGLTMRDSLLRQHIALVHQTLAFVISLRLGIVRWLPPTGAFK